MKKKLLGAIGVVSAAALALSGCGSGSGSGGGSSSAKATSFNLWAVSGTPTLKPFVDDYNKSHPNGQVKLREIDFANYDATLAQAANAGGNGNAPDLEMMNSVSLGLFASKGQVRDISKVVPLQGDLAPSSFFPGFVDAAKYKGVQVGLPIDTGSRVLQYNAKLFKKAGVKPFGDTASWTDIVSAAQKIKALGSGYQGFCWAGGQNWLALYEGIGPVVHQFGGDFFNADLTQSTIDSPQAVAAFNAFKALAATGDKSNTVAQSGDGCTEKLGAGTLGMQIGGFWALPSDKQVKADKFELGQSLPTGPSGMSYSSTGGWMLSLTNHASSSKYAIMKDFITEMYKADNLIKFTGLFPATVNGMGAATAFNDPKYKIYKDILQKSAGHPIPLNPQLPNQATIVMNALQSVVQGQPTEQVLQKAQSDLNDTLKG